jgi:hypothetical protein
VACVQSTLKVGLVLLPADGPADLGHIIAPRLLPLAKLLHCQTQRLDFFDADLLKHLWATSPLAETTSGR